MNQHGAIKNKNTNSNSILDIPWSSLPQETPERFNVVQLKRAAVLVGWGKKIELILFCLSIQLALSHLAILVPSPLLIFEMNNCCDYCYYYHCYSIATATNHDILS